MCVDDKGPVGTHLQMRTGEERTLVVMGGEATNRLGRDRNFGVYSEGNFGRDEGTRPTGTDKKKGPRTGHDPT